MARVLAARRRGHRRAPDKTSSVRDWAQHLLEHAAAPATLDELEWWNEQADADTVAIPVRDSGSNRVRDVDVVEADLDPPTTRAVLTTVPGVIGGHVDDVLVAALVRTVTRWCGRDTISIDVEAHGREELAPHLDVSRTVGWLTAISPARCTVQHDETFAESARSIGARLATRPHRGIGYGVLRYLSPDPGVRAQLAALPPRPISFNYLGQFGGHGDAAGDGAIRAAPEPAGPMRHPDGARAHLIEVDASVVGERLDVPVELQPRAPRRVPGSATWPTICAPNCVEPSPTSTARRRNGLVSRPPASPNATSTRCSRG